MKWPDKCALGVSVFYLYMTVILVSFIAFAEMSVQVDIVHLIG